MANKFANKMKFSIYNSFTTWTLILGLTSMCILAFGLSAFFVIQFLVKSFDPGVFVLLLIIDCPWVIVVINLSQQGLFLRLFSRIYVSEEGIYIRYFTKPITVLRWDEIHAYGITGYSVAYTAKTIVYMTRDSKDFAPKNIQEANAISANRVAFEYRKEIWLLLSEYMPLDMKRKLSDSLIRKQDCFFKR